MERFIVEFGLRSGLIAGAAALVLLVLKIRAAAAQHHIWTGVVVVMLTLPIWLQWGPKAALPILPASEPAIFTNALTVQTAPSVIPTQVEIPAQAPKPALWSWDMIIIGVYLLGAGALLLRLLVGTIRASRLTSESCATPVTVGVLRPRVILPNHWREWSPEQLDAILTHEQEHARRRDPLVQWLALLNRALFWFHPLAWWIERRLSALAEEACDAAVLAQGHDPRSYSEYLLDMARAVQRAGVRMAMPGSYLPQRIKKMIVGITASRVSPARMACAAIACVICSATFAAGTLEHVTPIQLRPILPQAYAPNPEVILPPAESAPRRDQMLLAQAKVVPQMVAQSKAAATPKFEVASIKPCGDGDFPPEGRGGRGNLSPGRLNLNCQTVMSLIQGAYVLFANGRVNLRSSVTISGGPAWINSAYYRVEAKGESSQRQEVMRGPMMQALLEGRFRLKIRRETKSVPVYALTIAKGGPKLQKFNEGSCTPMDFTVFKQFPPAELAPGINWCRSEASMKKLVVTLDTHGMNVDEFSEHYLNGTLDRPVINKTGIRGRFDFRLVYGADEMTPGLPRGGDAVGAPIAASDPTGPSIFTALPQQLGLKLEPAKGPGEFLVIDHVERPSEN